MEVWKNRKFCQNFWPVSNISIDLECFNLTEDLYIRIMNIHSYILVLRSLKLIEN